MPFAAQLWSFWQDLLQVQGCGSCDSAGLVCLWGHCWGLLELPRSVIVLLKFELAKFCVSLS